MSRAVPPSPGRRRPTATSAFGVSRRESHDASAFYARFTAPQLSDDDHVEPPAALDRIWVGDARRLRKVGEVAASSVALVVTSPPYFAGKEYEAELGRGGVPAGYAEYLGLLRDVFAECVQVLEPGGRIAVNVANLGRKPYRSLAGDVAAILEGLGLLLRGEIVWRKAHAPGGSCAWGSFRSPANPVLRDVTERVVVASKGRFDRAVDRAGRARLGLPHVATVTKDEFADATVDLWDLPAESATRVGHPAPFPVALPQRLIELYTYRDDLVLDPFMGSGSTAVAAVRTGRHYVGFDMDPAYVAAAEARVALEAAAVDERAGATPASGGDAVEQLTTSAAAMLGEAGFTAVTAKASVRGVGFSTSLAAVGADGTRWWFDVVGGRSATRPGLRREEHVWVALGRAATVVASGEARGERRRYAVLASDLPSPGSPGARALALATSPSGDVAAVVALLEPGALDALRALAAGSA